MLTLEERIARLEKQTHVVSLHADSAAISDIPDEVRAQSAPCAQRACKAVFRALPVRQ